MSQLISRIIEKIKLALSPRKKTVFYKYEGTADVEMVMRDVHGTYVLQTNIPWSFESSELVGNQYKETARDIIHQTIGMSRQFMKLKEKTGPNHVYVNLNDLHKFYIREPQLISTTKR